MWHRLKIGVGLFRIKPDVIEVLIIDKVNENFLFTFSIWVNKVEILLSYVKSILKYYLVESDVVSLDRIHSLWSLTDGLIQLGSCVILVLMKLHQISSKQDFLIFFGNGQTLKLVTLFKVLVAITLSIVDVYQILVHMRMIVVEVHCLVLSIREEATCGTTFAEYFYHQLDVLLDELVPAMINNASTFLRQKSHPWPLLSCLSYWKL